MISRFRQRADLGSSQIYTRYRSFISRGKGKEKLEIEERKEQREGFSAGKIKIVARKRNA